MPTSAILPAGLWEAEQFLRELPHWHRPSATLDRILPDLVLMLGQARRGDCKALWIFGRVALADVCGVEILDFLRQYPPDEEEEIA